MTNPNSKLDFDACYNARDLGGIATPSGASIRWAAFVRADSLARLTAQGKASVLAHGIRTVIDLRLPEELERGPNPFANSGELNFVHASLIDVTRNELFNEAIKGGGMLAWNLQMLDVSGKEIAGVFKHIAAAPAGGVLFHCYAGKDRTGLIAMFLLGLAGVDENTIAEDYDESNKHLSKLNQELMDTWHGDEEMKQAVLRNLLSGKDNALKIQTYLRENYGDAAAYLAQHGVSADELARVKARLLSD